MRRPPEIHPIVPPQCDGLYARECSRPATHRVENGRDGYHSLLCEVHAHDRYRDVLKEYADWRKQQPLGPPLPGPLYDIASDGRLVPSHQEDWTTGVGIDYSAAYGLYSRSYGYAAPAGADVEAEDDEGEAECPPH